MGAAACDALENSLLRLRRAVSCRRSRRLWQPAADRAHESACASRQQRYPAGEGGAGASRRTARADRRLPARKRRRGVRRPVRTLLPKLQLFVQREVSALRARGDLNPGEPTPQDIVDEVLTRAYQRLGGERPKDVDPLHWLYQLTHEALNDEARKYRKEEGRFLSIGSSKATSTCARSSGNGLQACGRGETACLFRAHAGDRDAGTGAGARRRHEGGDTRRRAMTKR